MTRDRLDFLVIGAQKCATSWLYYCLRDHPQIHVPARKREREYLGGDLYQQNGADWYFSLCAPMQPAQRSGAVSVEYLYDPRAVEVVAELLPRVQLIACLRDPIDRLVSAYYWAMRKHVIDDLPLGAGVTRAIEAFERGERTLPADLIARGLYDLQLERYLNRFSREHLHIVLYDEVRATPSAVVRDVYEFIGVNGGFDPPSLREKPKHNTYLKPLLALERLAPNQRWMSKLVDATSQFVGRVGVKPVPPKLDAETRGRLAAFYRPHLDATADMVAGLGTPAAAQKARAIRAWAR